MGDMADDFSLGGRCAPEPPEGYGTILKEKENKMTIENRAVMFKKKEGDTSNRPEYTLKVNFEGKEKEIGLFLSDKKTQYGDPMWTGKVQEPWKKPEAKQEPVSANNAHTEIDDDFDDIF
jgi:hypothetical protein